MQAIPRNAPISRSNILLWFSIAACAVVVVLSARPLIASPQSTFIDFRAFYCASKLAASGVDPYLAHPLFACEASVRGAFDSHRLWEIPAPVPGALFLLLAPLTAFPYDVAAWLWYALLVAAIGFTTLLVVDLTRLSPAMVIAALALGEGFTALDVGNIVPFAVLVLVASAWLVQRGRPAAAAATAVVSLVEPHLGFAAVLALLVWVPRARLATVLGCIAFAIATFVSVGLGPNLEYVRFVLPAQAQAEAYAWNQYSLTFLLTTFGMPLGAAVRWGTVSYALMLCASLWAAPFVARRIGSLATIVLFPVAAVTLGGPYVHFGQVAAALPFALLLYASKQSVARFAAIAALAIPGYALLLHRAVAIPLTIARGALLAAAIVPMRARTIFYTVSLTALFAVGSPLVVATLGHVPNRGAVPAAPASTRYASQAWLDYEHYFRVEPQWTLLVNVLPVWIALGIIVLEPLGWRFAVAFGRADRRVSEPFNREAGRPTPIARTFRRQRSPAP